MFSSLFSHLLASRHRARAIRHLRWLERRLPTPLLRLAVPVAFRGRGHFKSMKIMQHGEEILRLYERVLELAPRTVLEIGTARGGSLYLWTQAADPQAHLISVDLPGGPFGGGYPACRIPYYESFARPGQRLDLVRADALAPSTRGRIEGLLEGRPVDFLFIDADHRYEGVRGNFLLYAPLVRPGGLIALHDILPNPRQPRIGVWRLWDQLRDRADTRELIGSPDGGRPLGIGLLQVPPGGLDKLINAVRPEEPPSTNQPEAADALRAG